MSLGTIMIAGSLAQKPHQGGHTWVFMQYLLGFKRLGWEVIFLDRLEPEMCFDAAGQPCALQHSTNLRYFLHVMERFGLSNAFALLYDGGKQIIGLSRQQVLEHAKRAALLFNVMGFFIDEEILGNIEHRVFLDIDPGFVQMWQDLGLADLLQGHTYYVTIGENIGRSDCTIPTCGLEWITTPQPVVLADRPVVASESNGAFTSVVTWRGLFGPLQYGGQTYGLRVHEFRKYFEVPGRSGQPFEIALDIHPAEGGDLALLLQNNWSLADPQVVVRDPWTYQAFIQRSKAEFMVAKNMYVQSNSGWFSDRSICYLASGKPVLAQDTGIGHLYPIGEGLLTFTTLEEALTGVKEITHNYSTHAGAARELAEEYFDSDKILHSLLTKLGIV